MSQLPSVTGLRELSQRSEARLGIRVGSTGFRLHSIRCAEGLALVARRNPGNRLLGHMRSVLTGSPSPGTPVRGPSLSLLAPASLDFWLPSHSLWVTAQRLLALVEVSHPDVPQTSGRETGHTWREPSMRPDATIVSRGGGRPGRVGWMGKVSVSVAHQGF